MATNCTSTFKFLLFLFKLFFFFKVHGSPSEEKKQDFVNYKRVVWHRAIHLVLESVIEVSMTGYWLMCGDGVQRWLFPVVLILSADYEEQCDLVLIILCYQCLIKHQ
jgi:Plavaka transposase